MDYGCNECLNLRHRTVGALPEHSRLENVTMSRVRENIEWSYGETSNLFPFVTYENSQLLLIILVVEAFITGTFMRNCYVTIDYNNASKFFDCDPSSLESWLGYVH